MTNWNLTKRIRIVLPSGSLKFDEVFAYAWRETSSISLFHPVQEISARRKDRTCVTERGCDWTSRIVHQRIRVNCQRFVTFGYLTRAVLLVLKTSPFERNGKPPVRPPATRESYQPCWKWSSPLGRSRCCFYTICNIYVYLRVLYCHWYLWCETKLSLACTCCDSCNHTVLFRVFNFSISISISIDSNPFSVSIYFPETLKI